MPTNERQLMSDIKILTSFYGEGKTADQTALELGVSRAKVYKAAERARERGAIKYSVDPLPLLPSEHEYDLETAIRNRFSLRHAVVLNMPPEITGVYRFNYEMDSILHRALGREAARYLRLILRNGDLLGLGGGRAINQLSEEFETDPTRAITTTRSLEGGTTHIAPRPNQKRISADGAAWKISQSDLVHTKRPELVSLPTYLESANQDSIGAYFTLPSTGNVNIAVFEVESVDDNHSLLSAPYFIPDAERREGGSWREIKDGLNKFSNFKTASAVMERYIPLMECLNILYFVPNIKSNNNLPINEALGNMQENINKLNKYAVGTRYEDLIRVPIRIGIGGGVYKVSQLHYALTQEFITDLITDQACAVELLKTA